MKNDYDIAKENKETVIMNEISKKNIQKPIVGYDGHVPGINNMEFHG